jgi:PAS domain S-box-containing protein
MKTSRILPVVVFAAAALLLSAAGWQYYSQGKRHVRAAAVAELTAVAELKRDLVANWRRERLGDARVISSAPFGELYVVPFLEARMPTRKQADDIRAWMNARLEAYGYLDAVLVDAERKARLASGPTRAEIGETARAAVGRILLSGETEISDFHLADPIPYPHLDLYAPIRRARESGRNPECAGVLVLRIDPRRFLWPLLDSMPVPGASAETILVRRDKEDFLVLNDLRLRKGTALLLRNPIRARESVDGVVEGPDYRGEPVLSVIRAIPESPWHLIVKKDSSEIFRPLRIRMLAVGIAFLIFAACLALAMLFWMKRREARSYRRELEDERRNLALVRHFEYLHKFANDIILLADNGQRIIEANERACEEYGYSRDDLLTKSFPDLIGSEIGIAFADALREAATKNGLIFEAVHLRRNGTTFPVEISLRTIDIEGSSYHQAIIRDITERQTMLEALRASEAKFKVLFEMANDAIFLLDGETFVDCNKKTLEIFGCGREDILGRKPSDFSPPLQPDGTKSEDKARELIRKGMAGIPQSFEWKHRKFDGSEIDTEVSLSRTEVGGRLLVQAIVRDISARKKGEAGLKEAIREKDVLLREIHHRVKNNMQVISSLLNLQAERFKDKEVREAFKESQGRIRSMALIHEKLYRARNLSEVDFSEYVTSLTASVIRAYQVNPERARFKLDLDRVSLDINASIPCGLILNEIILNALKHAFPEGGTGEIHIELREKEDGGVRLTVRDNGIGFPEGIDIRNTDTLGLQIVSLLTDQLEGKFDIRNDRGTVFSLSFQSRRYRDRV